jgi:hypothetical protein
MLTIVSYGEGKCVWCCQDGEGVQATFKDGLSGFLCKRDFWAAVKARASDSPPASEAKSPSAKNT